MGFHYLIVWKVFETQEEESCFVVPTEQIAQDWIACHLIGPAEYEHTHGKYFYEQVEAVWTDEYITQWIPK